jgi:hypothetical protein
MGRCVSGATGDARLDAGTSELAGPVCQREVFTSHLPCGSHGVLLGSSPARNESFTWMGGEEYKKVVLSARCNVEPYHVTYTHGFFFLISRAYEARP